MIRKTITVTWTGDDNGKWSCKTAAAISNGKQRLRLRMNTNELVGGSLHTGMLGYLARDPDWAGTEKQFRKTLEGK